MAITASVQPVSGRIVYAGSDFLHPFQYRFPKKAWIIRRTDPDPIWMACAGFGQTHLDWKQAGVQESLGPVSGRTQPARYQPVSHFQTRFRSSTDVPDNIVQNQTGSDLVLADCVRFWPNGSGPEASQCARESSGPLLNTASQPTQTGSGVFTIHIFIDRSLLGISKFYFIAFCLVFVSFSSSLLNLFLI